MARRPATFRQTDVTRALRAARAAGVDVAGVEIDPVTGRIVLSIKPGEAGAETTSPLDRWMATNARPS